MSAGILFLPLLEPAPAVSMGAVSGGAVFHGSQAAESRRAEVDFQPSPSRPKCLLTRCQSPLL